MIDVINTNLIGLYLSKNTHQAENNCVIKDNIVPGTYMNTVIETTQSRQKSILRLNRPLIELEEYAKREGTTPYKVQQCSQIGIVSIRKYKGKTYVVDNPVINYEEHSQADKEVEELLGMVYSSKPEDDTPVKSKQKTSQKKKAYALSPFKAVGSTLLGGAYAIATYLKPKAKDQKPKSKKLIEDYIKNDQPTPPPILNQTIEPGSIAQLVREMLDNSEQIKAHAEKVEIQQTNAQKPIVDIKARKKMCEMTEQLIMQMHRQLDEIELTARKNCPARKAPQKN